MPAVRTVKVVAALLAGFFLFVPPVVFAQGLFEASDLNQRATNSRTPGDIPMLNRCTSSRLRSARKCWVPTILKLRQC